jgi:hypothetical protein
MSAQSDFRSAAMLDRPRERHCWHHPRAQIHNVFVLTQEAFHAATVPLEHVQGAAVAIEGGRALDYAFNGPYPTVPLADVRGARLELGVNLLIIEHLDRAGIYTTTKIPLANAADADEAFAVLRERLGPAYALENEKMSVANAITLPLVAFAILAGGVIFASVFSAWTAPEPSPHIWSYAGIMLTLLFLPTIMWLYLRLNQAPSATMLKRTT